MPIEYQSDSMPKPNLLLPVFRIKSLYLFFLLLLIAFQSEAGIRTTSLLVEGLSSPHGIDLYTPRLSWKLEADGETNVMQTAYQILVASSKELIEQGQADIWNSGKVKSSRSVWIDYKGKELQSNGLYFWKVRTWTNKGQADDSQVSQWSMGLFEENDWNAQWIGLDKVMPWDSETQWSRLSARYLRREFPIAKTVKRAMVHVSGLGLYELYINGNKIGNQVLAPAPTDYRKSILYNSFDVTSHIKNGDNALGVTLGNGRFYTMRQNYKTYKINTFGYPKLKLALIIEFTDGTIQKIISDGKWKLNADGPIRSNNEYDGEEYDANKEFGNWTSAGYDDSKWSAAERVSIPVADLHSQLMPGIQVLKQLPVQHMNWNGNDTLILDFGQNASGWLRIQVLGEKNDTLRMRFAETLKPDGHLYTANLRDARVTDSYILKGDPQGETWAPRFVYHGFRYAEITGLRRNHNSGNSEQSIARQINPNNNPSGIHDSSSTNISRSDFSFEVVGDSMANTGKVITSDPVLNQVLTNAWWGILSNYKGMPVDCPQRNERMPWLGDRTMGSLGESFLFDNRALYLKWGRDIVEAQRQDGCIPDVAPAYWNYYSDNITWPAALPFLCDILYRQYGDIQAIRDFYPAMDKWMRHVQKSYMSAEYTVDKDKYGDWCVPPESLELIHSQDPARQTPGDLISSAYFQYLSSRMSVFATLLGKTQEAISYKSLSVKLAEGFQKKFYHADAGTYGNGSTTSNLLPLAMGLVPEPNRKIVADAIVKQLLPGNMPSINTGVIGTQWLMRELVKMGRGDVAFALVTNSKYPSWGYMVSKGATTIWELWNGDTANPSMNSGNHVMLLGDLIPWTFSDLAGIQSDDIQTGYKKIIFKPDFSIDGLDSVSASYESPYGKIISSWRKTSEQLIWKIQIPANSQGEIHLPSGKVIQKGSGSYRFEEDLPQHAGVVKNQFIYEEAPYPSCHAATIVETREGDLVTAYFGGTREGSPDVCIWVSRKDKGSDKWSEPILAADGYLTSATKVFWDDTEIRDDSTRKACYNPVLYQEDNGKLNLFFKIGSRVSDWTGFLTVSKDGGRSWSKAYELPAGYLGPIKNKPIQVGNKIIAPSSTEVGGWKVHFEIAENGGRRIHQVGPLDAKNALLTQDMRAGSLSTGNDMEGGDDSKQNTIQAIQPSILTHKDGRLQILCRTRNGKLATSWSSDQGESWSPLELTNLPNNNSGTDAVTLMDGRQALIYNPVATLPGEKKGPRTPLAVAVSTDGIHWEDKVILEDSPVNQYSYPSIIQGKDGRIHVVYTWRRQRIKYAEIKL